MAPFSTNMCRTVVALRKEGRHMQIPSRIASSNLLVSPCPILEHGFERNRHDVYGRRRHRLVFVVVVVLNLGPWGVRLHLSSYPPLLFTHIPLFCVHQYTLFASPPRSLLAFSVHGSVTLSHYVI